MEKKEITKSRWTIFIWVLIILGGLSWAISYTLFGNHLQGNQIVIGLLSAGVTGGGILVGFGFGLAYSRFWKVRGIDG